ncbi:LIM domain transcription factor LMO4-B [Coccinella septempunctata]|uniref:LIM domain transcription factor LMO4-B n=1 Tax=Coccinella septempunctata TaxID=41139 RepID=UPI001D06A62F|nr:LIM domain transcription factor LMO4-B [Coccinella septempunctata]
MNPHYHSYGGTELTSPPHPPSPDNNNFHGHPGQGGGQHHNRMHPSNGHAINTLGVNPHHDQHPHQHPHHPHSGIGSGGPTQEEQMQMHNPNINNNTNNNNNTVRTCWGCGGKILERFLLHALDRYWHNGCLKCSCCAAMLADIGTSCFTRSGMILCKQDYMRIFGSTGACAACHQPIPPSEFVMRCSSSTPQQPTASPQVFHLKCFSCSKCGAPLVPGDRYYLLAGSLVCEQDWTKLLKSSTVAPTVRKGKVGRPRRSRD